MRIAWKHVIQIVDRHNSEQVVKVIFRDRIYHLVSFRRSHFFDYLTRCDARRPRMLPLPRR